MRHKYRDVREGGVKATRASETSPELGRKLGKHPLGSPSRLCRNQPRQVALRYTEGAPASSSPEEAAELQAPESPAPGAPNPEATVVSRTPVTSVPGTTLNIVYVRSGFPGQGRELWT